MFPRILSEFAATVTKVTEVPVEALFTCGFNIVPADFGSFPDGCLISTPDLESHSQIGDT